MSSFYIALLWFHSSSLYETHPWWAGGLDGWKLYTHDAEINKLLPDEKLAGGIYSVQPSDTYIICFYYVLCALKLLLPPASVAKLNMSTIAPASYSY